MKSLLVFCSLIACSLITLAVGLFGLSTSSYLWRRSIGLRSADLVRSDNIPMALRYLDGVTTPWWFVELERFSQTTGHGSLVKDSSETWVKEIRARVAQLEQFDTSNPNTEYGRKLTELHTEQRKITEARSRLNTRYQLLASGASELFHLELAGEEPRFYSGGLLAGLPIMKGLPDEIRTLPEMSTAITAAGGVVTVTEFARALESLLAEGKALSDAFRQSELELEEIANQEIELKRSQISAKIEHQTALANQIEQDVS